LVRYLLLSSTWLVPSWVPAHFSSTLSRVKQTLNCVLQPHK
jgi:hypothetical protein